MGLFSDTIRDAHRPLPTAWLRRSPEPPVPEAPLEQPEAPLEEADSGMHTVFRFQKGEAPAASGGSREASPRSRARTAGALTADPLSTGAEVGTPEPSVRSVSGNEGISVVEVNRGSELETGQVEHGSPGKIAAANVKSESNTHTSASLSERVETEPIRETHKSNIPDGSERSVSRNGVTSQSRLSGRGASPSESPSTPERKEPSALRPGPMPVSPEPVPRTGAEDGSSVVPPAPAARSKSRGGPDSPPSGSAPPNRVRAPSPPSTSAPLGGGLRSAPPPAPRLPRERDPAPPQPTLVIGRLEVVVVADTPARSKAPPTPTPDGAFLNRNYLRRL